MIRKLLFLVSAAMPLFAIESVKIWDQAPHSAFTDLAYFKGQWVCAFREGRRHVSTDGTLRVIASRDGRNWRSLAKIEQSGKDLRDPKLTITPRGELMLTTAAAVRDADNVVATRHDSEVWFSSDGERWRGPTVIGDPDYWLWRTTWAGKRAYAVGYPTGTRDGRLRLYSSTDGRAFEVVVPEMTPDGGPNETTLRFLADGTALAFVRREAGTKTALLGRSAAPYKEWAWTDLGARAGGPNFVEMGGRLIGVVRLHDGKVRTSIVELDPKGALREIETLPSSGDSSYAGLVVRGGELWISYYSSHEGKSAIYLARWRP